MISRKTLCLAAAWFLLSPVVIHAADKWLEVRSRNFVLVGSAGESQMKRVARHLEEFRAAIGLLFPAVTRESSVDTTVIVFRNEAGFRPYKPLYESKPIEAAAYFIGGADMSFIAMPSTAGSERLIYHELLHYLTKDRGAPLPAWAAEGLAEFYSTFDITPNGKSLNVGIPLSEHVATLRRYAPLPLATFFAVDHKSPEYNERSKSGIFYAQSWATVHYLMLGNNGNRRAAFANYLDLLSKGRPALESFREAFQMEYAAFETELLTYLRNRFTYPYTRFELQTKLDVDKDMEVSAVSEAAVQLHLGNLLLHINRLDAAEEHLQRALALDESLGPAYAAMGRLRTRQERHDDALAFMTRAVDSGSGNHLAHYYYASLLERKLRDGGEAEETETWSLMRTHLKRSLELAPGFLEAYGLLGYVTLRLEDEFDETEKSLRRALGMAPGREDIQLTLYQIMARNGKAVAARTLLTQLKDASLDARIREGATQTLEGVARLLEYEQAMRDFDERRRESLSAAESRIREAPAERPVIARAEPRVPEAPAPEAPRGPEIEGHLTMIDCSSGATLRVRVGNGHFELHTADPSRIQFTSYVANVSASIACGPVRPELPVRIRYRRGSDPRFLGEPLAVEFRGN